MAGLLALLSTGWGCGAARKPSASATVDPQFAEFCAANPCRGRTVVNLVHDDGKPFHLDLPMAPPIVQPQFVTIYAGETIFLEADVSDGRLVNVRAVERVVNPERTVEFRFRQDTGVGKGSEMLLTVRNGFPHPLKYSLGMMLPSDPEPQPGQRPVVRRSSTCPVLPNKAAFEHWPHAIYLLLANDFRLVDPSDPAAMTCE